MNILLADDNDLVRISTSKMLEHVGHSVTTVRHGQDAIAELQGRQDGYFHVLITDWHMPVMDGHALLEWLKTSPYWRMLVIVTTASSDPLPIPQSVLRKPYNFDRLLDLLQVERGIVA